MGTSTVSKNKRSKAAKSALAVTLALLLALGGTFAWVSVQVPRSEVATNALKNPGGRMHDDFKWMAADNHDKDVYAENFGEKDIFVRVQLREYLEIGEGAAPGTVKNDTDGIIEYPTAASQVNNNDWLVRGYESPEGTPTPDTIQDYFDLKFGRAASDGAKWYMPTFNMDKDSAVPDVKGALRDAGGPYSGYKSYAEGDTEESTEDLGGGNMKENATHTVNKVPGSTVVTMSDFSATDYAPGPYWVYDDSTENGGWFYWAQAVKPGEATGLLLDDVSPRTEIEDAWYYAIDAVGEFVTAEEPTAGEDGSAYYLNDGVGEDAQQPISEGAYKLLRNAIDVSAVLDAPVAMTNTEACEVQLEGRSYYKLAEDVSNPNKVMLLTKDMVASMAFDDTSNIWYLPASEDEDGSATPAKDSKIKNWCNSEAGGYIASLPAFTKSRLMPHKYKTKRAYNTTIDLDNPDPATYYESESKVFLLSRSDITGSGSDFYTYNSQLIPYNIDSSSNDPGTKIRIVEEISESASHPGVWWLRSPHANDMGLSVVNSKGRVDNLSNFRSLGVRPAFWIDLAPSNS